MKDASENTLCDDIGRRLTYFRVSVTNQCGLSCLYCKPRDAAARSLEAESILRIVRILAGMGIRKVRLTGGEPLERGDICAIAGMISSVGGIEGVSVTTNGARLKEFANKLHDAGVSGVNVHLDSLNPRVYKKITCGGILDGVIGGIESALDAGFQDVKLNSVLMRGVNDHEVEDLIAFAAKLGVSIRFIELMPMGSAADFYEKHFISAREVIERIGERYELAALPRLPGRGPARYFKLAKSGAVIGFIGHSSAVSCGDCNRLRLLSDGTFMDCIASPRPLALAKILAKMDDEEIAQIIGKYICAKSPDHGGFAHARMNPSFEMHEIGG